MPIYYYSNQPPPELKNGIVTNKNSQSFEDEALSFESLEAKEFEPRKTDLEAGMNRAWRRDQPKPTGSVSAGFLSRCCGCCRRNRDHMRDSEKKIEEKRQSGLGAVEKAFQRYCFRFYPRAQQIMKIIVLLHVITNILWDALKDTDTEGFFFVPQIHWVQWWYLVPALPFLLPEDLRCYVWCCSRPHDKDDDDAGSRDGSSAKKAAAGQDPADTSSPSVAEQVDRSYQIWLGDFQEHVLRPWWKEWLTAVVMLLVGGLVLVVVMVLHHALGKSEQLVTILMLKGCHNMGRAAFSGAAQAGWDALHPDSPYAYKDHPVFAQSTPANSSSLFGVGVGVAGVLAEEQATLAATAAATASSTAANVTAYVAECVSLYRSPSGSSGSSWMVQGGVSTADYLRAETAAVYSSFALAAACFLLILGIVLLLVARLDWQHATAFTATTTATLVGGLGVSSTSTSGYAGAALSLGVGPAFWVFSATVLVGLLACYLGDAQTRRWYWVHRRAECERMFFKERMYEARAHEQMAYADFSPEERAAVEAIFGCEDDDEEFGGKGGRKGTSSSSSSSRTRSNTRSNPLDRTALIRFEDLELTKKIGAGAYGEVFAADYLGTQVVVKRILRGRLNTRNLANFRDEIRLMMTLRHPNIVQLIGVSHNSYCNVCAVLEWVPNGDLFSLINSRDKKATKGALTWQDPLHKMAVDIARGMVYLHANGILHRDLKSLNVLVTSTFSCKVTDFGASRKAPVTAGAAAGAVSGAGAMSVHRAPTSASAAAKATGNEATMTFSGVGTALWLAPELVLRTSYSEKVDCFAFGIVLAEMETRAPPYEALLRAGKTPLEIMGMVAREGMRPTLSPQSANLPALARLITDLTAHNPEARPSMNEALRRLQHEVRREIDAESARQAARQQRLIRKRSAAWREAERESGLGLDRQSGLGLLGGSGSVDDAAVDVAAPCDDSSSFSDEYSDEELTVYGNGEQVVGIETEEKKYATHPDGQQAAAPTPGRTRTSTNTSTQLPGRPPAPRPLKRSSGDMTREQYKYEHARAEQEQDKTDRSRSSSGNGSGNGSSFDVSRKPGLRLDPNTGVTSPVSSLRRTIVPAAAAPAARPVDNAGSSGSSSSSQPPRLPHCSGLDMPAGRPAAATRRGDSSSSRRPSGALDFDTEPYSFAEQQRRQKQLLQQQTVVELPHRRGMLRGSSCRGSTGTESTVVRALATHSASTSGEQQCLTPRGLSPLEKMV